MEAMGAFAYLLTGSGLLASCLVSGPARHAYAADSVYECNQYNGGRQVALLVNHRTGAITPFTGTTTAATIQAAVTAAQADTTQPTTSSSGAGDTVIVCHGTYAGNLSIGVGNDNLTVRSEDGPSGVVIVGDGSAPVVTIDDRGLTFGGPAEGFTISMAAPATTTSVTGIQEGVPGAQSTTNEDEQCVTDPGGVPTSSGCDQSAPADVTINDQIVDNVFTGFKVPATSAVTGIKLDNTINSTIQQNLFRNMIPDHSGAGAVAGIVVGGFNETPPSDPSGNPPAGYTKGDSTNINTAVLQNTLNQVVQGSNSTCATVDGIELNGFLLDATVYNNLLKALVDNDDTSCALTAIFSNAYGSLENEQTGTLAPVNANIDDNAIEQEGPVSESPNSRGILLEPTPANATPPPQGPPQTCSPQLGENCNDGFPPSSYTVVQNELQALYRAVDDEAVLGANSYIRDNNFDGDAIGVQNGSAAGPQNTGLDATNDWWGCELSGSSPPPSSASTNNHGCAALVSPPGATSWSPPQSSRVESAGAGAGNQAGTS